MTCSSIVFMFITLNNYYIFHINWIHIVFLLLVYDCFLWNLCYLICILWWISNQYYIDMVHITPSLNLFWIYAVFLCVFVIQLSINTKAFQGVGAGLATNFFFLSPSFCNIVPAPINSSSLFWTTFKGPYYKIFPIFLLLCAFYIHIFLSAYFPKTSNFPQDETQNFISLQNRGKIIVLWSMF